jgi:hypothetical protein
LNWVTVILLILSPVAPLGELAANLSSFSAWVAGVARPIQSVKVLGSGFLDFDLLSLREAFSIR